LLPGEVFLRTHPRGASSRDRGIGPTASPLGKSCGVESGPSINECLLGTRNVILGVASIFPSAGGLVVAHPLAHCDLSPRRRHARPGFLVIEIKDRLPGDHFVIDGNCDSADTADDGRQDFDLT
jgi:hypothetical protein